jgi:hypothetical protein
VKGTGLTFHRQVDRNWMIDSTCDWYWPLAEELGIGVAGLGQQREYQSGLVGANN